LKSNASTKRNARPGGAPQRRRHRDRLPRERSGGIHSLFAELLVGPATSACRPNDSADEGQPTPLSRVVGSARAQFGHAGQNASGGRFKEPWALVAGGAACHGPRPGHRPSPRNSDPRATLAAYAATPTRARQPLPPVITARKPGRGPKLAIPPTADDPEATARVRAFLSRMIRPPGD
jgi:hypothetical protein